MTNSHKHAYKSEEFKFIKRFTVFKTVNYFSKIKEAFTAKLKIISFNHYFHPYQTPKNAKNIFQKTFYTETNRALVYLKII
jgi:hypothetical protein